MSLIAAYKKSFNNKRLIRFRTKHPEGDSFGFYGIVLEEKDSYIILAQERDFEFDGLVLLPKKVIKGYRDSKFEDCSNKIIRHNKAINKLNLPKWLTQCHEIQDVLKEIKDRDIWPIIEIIFDHGKESALYIGPISDVNNNIFNICGYDAAGKWGKICKLNVDEIFKIEINSLYAKHFNHFMRSINKRRTGN